MQIRLNIQDNLTAELRKRMEACGDTTPLAVAGAVELKSWAERAFDDPSRRPTAWPARKKAGTHHPLLKLHGLLWRSFRVNPAGAGAAEVVTDRPYAAVHQFGSAKAKGRGGGIPARPYFPFDGGGALMPAAAELLLATVNRRLQALLDGKA